jgi:hypothetical protein
MLCSLQRKVCSGIHTKKSNRHTTGSQGHFKTDPPRKHPSYGDRPHSRYGDREHPHYIGEVAPPTPHSPGQIQRVKPSGMGRGEEVAVVDKKRGMPPGMSSYMLAAKAVVVVSRCCCFLN